MTFTELLLIEFANLQARLDARLVLYVSALLALFYVLRSGLLATIRVVWRVGWDRTRRLARFRSIADVTLLAVVVLLASRKLAIAAPVLTALALAVSALLVAIALPSWVQDFVAGLALAARSRFREGDQVRLEAASGAVRHIGLLRTAIRAGDGGTLWVPNREVIAHTIQVGREQRAAPVEILLPPEAVATPELRESLLRVAHLCAFRRGGSRPALIETERGSMISMQTWSTRDIEGARRALERQLLGTQDGAEA